MFGFKVVPSSVLPSVLAPLKAVHCWRLLLPSITNKPFASRYDRFAAATIASSDFKLLHNIQAELHSCHRRGFVLTCVIRVCYLSVSDDLNRGDVLLCFGIFQGFSVNVFFFHPYMRHL